jgi:hypothetical protein
MHRTRSSPSTVFFRLFSTEFSLNHQSALPKLIIVNDSAAEELHNKPHRAPLKLQRSKRVSQNLVTVTLSSWLTDIRIERNGGKIGNRMKEQLAQQGQKKKKEGRKEGKKERKKKLIMFEKISGCSPELADC